VGTDASRWTLLSTASRGEFREGDRELEDRTRECERSSAEGVDTVITFRDRRGLFSVSPRLSSRVRCSGSGLAFFEGLSVWIEIDSCVVDLSLCFLRNWDKRRSLTFLRAELLAEAKRCRLVSFRGLMLPFLSARDEVSLLSSSESSSPFSFRARSSMSLILRSLRVRHLHSPIVDIIESTRRTANTETMTGS
jgi:hypothetical protein